jgi:hypothetical protein
MTQIVELSSSAAQALLALLAGVSGDATAAHDVYVQPLADGYRIVSVAPDPKADANPSATTRKGLAYSVGADRRISPPTSDATPDPASTRLAAASTRALRIAVARLAADGHPPLSHYDVQITPGDTTVEVVFIPLLAPGERYTRGGATSLGREVHYDVDLATNAVVRTSFGR